MAKFKKGWKRVHLFEDHPRRKRMRPYYLLELQKTSNDWFLETGLKEELQAISPVKGHDGRLELSFTGQTRLEAPKYIVQEALIRELTYAAPLKARVRLVDKESGEVKEESVF